MHQPVRDLFGQVPVTLPEIDAWLQAVPRIDPTSPRAANYVKWYAVADKIRAAKLAGMLDAILAREPPPDHWWRRFRWG